MFENMRQRGPTATAISPGLYLDKHATNSMTSENSVANNVTSVNAQSGIFTNESTVMTTVPSSISPMYSGNKVNGFVNSNKISRSDYNSKIMNQRQTFGASSHLDVSKSAGRYLSHRKLRKKGKREIRFQQLNGDSTQSLHSLKVTIRRTYKSNKADTGMCTIVNTSPQSRPANLNSINVTNDTTPKSTTDAQAQDTCNHKTPENRSHFDNQDQTNYSCDRVDVVTSTLDSATLTEPDLLGPCEPGTKLVVEGVVWLESPGMLVLSVQWRGRNYMGTLLDAPKQSFAPTCTDKGVISALSLLRGRKPWSYGSPGGYRTRGVHHYHHHCRPYHHRRRGGHASAFGVVGSMTTRSATAAAAAAITKTNLSLLGEPVWKSGQTSPVDDQYLESYTSESLQTPDDALNCNSVTNNVSNLHRGIKGRRRRGPGRRLYPTETTPTSLTTSSLSPKVEESDEIKSGPSNHLLEKKSVADLPLSCPFQNCEKRFSDLLSMRYHFTLGHSSQGAERIYDPTPRPCNREFSKNEVYEGFRHALMYCESATSSPPKLARAHSTKDRLGDSNDLGVNTTNSDDVEDNLDPPKLQRVVAIQDPFQTCEDASKHGKLVHSPDIHDEPPAPSPAYSDISDDGTEAPRVCMSVLHIPSTQFIKQSQYASSPSLMTDQTTQPCVNLTNGLNFPPVILSSPPSNTLDRRDSKKLFFDPTGLVTAKAVNIPMPGDAQPPASSDFQRVGRALGNAKLSSVPSFDSKRINALRLPCQASVSPSMSPELVNLASPTFINSGSLLSDMHNTFGKASYPHEPLIGAKVIRPSSTGSMFISKIECTPACPTSKQS